MPDHISGCAMAEARPCPAGRSPHGEPKAEHWWSGFPGAVCLKCGDPCAEEECLAVACNCPCHDEMWKRMDEMFTNRWTRLRIAVSDWIFWRLYNARAWVFGCPDCGRRFGKHGEGCLPF